MSEFSISMEQDGDASIARVHGEVDMDTSPRLREQLQGAMRGPGRLVVDLSAVGYIDSSGVAVLIQALKHAGKHGADAAEVLVRDGSEMSAKVRLGEPEVVQEAGSRALGIRVFKDHRRSVTYTSDMRPEARAFTTPGKLPARSG